MHAYRNVDLCTKDCLCLFVCPTGASDTETGQIDFDKCIGCGKCVMACPSGALTLIPSEYPPQQKKKNEVINALKILSDRKIEQEILAKSHVDSEENPIKRQLLKALAESNRIMAEDLIRESGFMIPQSGNVHKFLLTLQSSNKEGFPTKAIDLLLNNLKFNEKIEEPKVEIPEKWKCSVCGYIHVGKMSDDFTCPVCKQPASVFEKL